MACWWLGRAALLVQVLGIDGGDDRLKKFVDLLECCRMSVGETGLGLSRALAMSSSAAATMSVDDEAGIATHEGI